MFLKQYYLDCLAHASYMIADDETKTAIVVDPQRDIEQYLAEAQEHGFSIDHVFLTHFHADFVAGHIELRERAGATIHLGVRASAEYAFTPARTGDVLRAGQLKIEVLETPGHTPEGISLVVYDLAQSESPHAVLTGDTLFIGDVGRPDLMASVGVTADELAAMMYDSLHEKLMRLPDETLVYPAHGAGSMCGKSLSTDTVSTIGAQKAHNYALQAMSKEEFVRMATTGLPQAPDYFSHDAEMNRKDRDTLEESMGAQSSLTLEEALDMIEGGAQLIDVREPADFAGAHVRGAMNLPLDGKFATWAGSLLRRDAPIVIIAEPGREGEAAMRLGRIGFDHVSGHLEGGMATLAGRQDLFEATERITSTTLAEQLDSEVRPIVLDVRTASEWERGHVPGSQNIPLSQLGERLDEVPRDSRVVTMCRTGYRSSVAASILTKSGFDNVVDQVGGFVAWEASGDACKTVGASGTCSSSQTEINP